MYLLQYKGLQLLKQRKTRKSLDESSDESDGDLATIQRISKRVNKNLKNSIKIQTRTLSLVENYLKLNLITTSSTHGQKEYLRNKMELRELKLQSLVLRMKAYRKALMYDEAFLDAKKAWELMTPKERAKNITFKQEHLNELQVLKKHNQCNLVVQPQLKNDRQELERKTRITKIFRYLH